MTEYPSMTVYSASAGAGKTFTLAVRYIELLIENPYAFRETLAVTFTNKATEEMKMRILSQLYGLAHHLHDSRGYMERIQRDLELDEKTIGERAEMAMKLIMHDYSHFAVETIDAFFQRILRNLARELDLNPNLRVELNDTEVEALAVDELIAELKLGNEVLEWIMEYIHQQMTEDKSWNVIGNIKSFGKLIFSEPYRKNAEQLNTILSNKEFFNAFRESMYKLRNNADADQKMHDYGDEFFHLLDKHGYSTDDLLKKKTGASSYFIKLQKGEYLKPTFLTATMQKGIDGPEGWTNKGEDTAIYRFAQDILVPFIRNVEKERMEIKRLQSTATEVARHLNDLRLLNNIEQKMRELNNEAGRFMLSDTQRFLAALMRDEDAPFVYEKLGGRLLNIMIDEFQDTSTIQWNNFKKLLLNTLSDGNSKSLIVGDVKQSIYRWRNGDWGLLHNMDDDTDIRRFTYKREPLSDNWRSEERIINFNNKFFEAAAMQFKEYMVTDKNPLSQTITDIYDEHFLYQYVPDDKKKKPDYKVRGYVDMTLLSTADKDNETTQLQRTADIVRELLDAGAEETDIAILTRDKGHISLIADYMQQEIPDCTFISDEAYRLDASLAIDIIIAAMRVLLHNDDYLHKAQLARVYQEQVKHNHNVDLTTFREKEEIDKLLPEDFTSRREQITAMPLTDIVEEIANIFELNTLADEAAYIYAFYDQLNAFAQNNVPELSTFIELWDESLHNKTIKNGDLKGICVMTVHKSKGLEFKHVIMPFCNWMLVLGSGDTLWCKTDEKPFADLPVVPAQFTKTKDTFYDSFYHEERLQNCIDNLNILYVAFTRAAHSLYVIGCNQATQKGISNQRISGFIQRTLPLLPNKLEGATFTGDPKSGDELHFTYGVPYEEDDDDDNDDDNENKNENILLRTAKDKNVAMHNVHGRVEFRQSNASRSFVSADIDDKTANFIETGTILHDVLSRIDTHKDIERVLKDFEQQGIISSRDTEMNTAKMATFLRKRLTENKHEEVNRWFADSVKVMNECTIVYKDPRTGITSEKRPDRVVIDGDAITIIDFKFGNPSTLHKSQVTRYVELMKEMGYGNVKGCLWYVYQNEVVPV